jgi:hypothetical protein
MNRTMGKSMVFIDRNFQVTINLSEKVWKSMEKYVYSKLESVMSCMQTTKTLPRLDLVIYFCGKIDRELL